MARTYRRKHDRPAYRDFDGPEDFYQQREHWLKNYPKPVHPSMPALPPQHKVDSWWRWRDPEVIRIQAVRHKIWSAWYDSEEYRNWSAGRNFSFHGAGCDTYEDYLKREDAIKHSDHGWGSRWCKRAPGWVANLYSQRPARQHDRLQIKRGIAYDNWDELHFYKFTRDAAWNYW